jgi:membrane-associated phospholipid phosphatase
LRRLTRPTKRPSPALRKAVRIGAGAAVAASILVPAFRRKLKAPPAVSIAAAVAGPPALAVLRPRTRKRDVALYALQMWGFTMVHEIPYDDPEALRRRLRIHYPIKIDRWLGGGRLPNARLQRALAHPENPTALDRALSVVHWAWFLVPHLALLYILLRDESRFPRAARQMSATYDLGCVLYFAVPTAPPWWAAENGYAGEEVRRLMVDVGKDVWGPAWPFLYDSLGGNPWAAFPSLHFGSSLMAALLLAETGKGAGLAGFIYTFTLGFALVYLGEHYVTDLAAGAALVAAVRRGERLGEPAVLAINRVLQRLERIANG